MGLKHMSVLERQVGSHVSQVCMLARAAIPNLFSILSPSLILLQMAALALPLPVFSVFRPSHHCKADCPQTMFYSCAFHTAKLIAHGEYSLAPYLKPPTDTPSTVPCYFCSVCCKPRVKPWALGLRLLPLGPESWLLTHTQADPL